ncbi:hypothetical protein ACIRU2_23850 [Streptomyces sp. NPDC101169]|uniref:hypothetical protein n=1 Tax=unclassified Streptomyces TaxID=2593676 RepID=UPI00381056A8
MKPLARIRSSSVLWASPVVLLLVLAYYFTDITSDLRLDPLDYAPTVVDGVLRNLVPVAYAVAAALGAWEARKLGNADIWQWGAVRSRYAIAAHSLVPVVALAWLVLILPVVCGLIQTGTPPNTAGAGLLVLAMALCAAHAVIGFGWGTAVRHIAAVPVIAVLDFLALGWSTGLTVPWPRHLTSLYPGRLMFGELPTVPALVAPLLVGLGAAAAVALLWSGIPRAWLRAALAGALALSCFGGGYAIVKDWSYIGPRSTGNGSMSCTSGSPRICTPSAYAAELPALREEVTGTLRTLRGAGVEAHPATLTDTLAAVRYPEPSTTTDWHLPLGASQAAGMTPYQVARAAVRFECAPPATEPARLVYYWVSMKVGQGDVYLRRLSTEPDFTAGKRELLRARVNKVLGMDGADQAEWFRRTVASACGKAS